MKTFKEKGYTIKIWEQTPEMDYEDRNFDDFMNVMKVNAGGTFLCIQEGSKLMRDNKRMVDWYLEKGKSVS